MICNGCGKNVAQGIPCPGCRGMVYCSEICKSEAWKKHASICGLDFGELILADLQGRSAAGLPVSPHFRIVEIARFGQDVCKTCKWRTCLLPGIADLYKGPSRRCCNAGCSKADVIMPTATVLMVPCSMSGSKAHAVVVWFCSAVCKEVAMKR